MIVIDLFQNNRYFINVYTLWAIESTHIAH